MRYLCAALVAAAAIFSALTLPYVSDIFRLVLLACGAIFAAMLAWEIVLLAIAAFVAYLFFGALAALPTSVAIIIGAYMIASSQRRT